ncbi:MAG: LysM peptidoglycan-binding domain-containing protein [Oceanipulchritudo sp.]
MKIWSVFSLVILFHVFILGILLLQPGCQSQSGRDPAPAETASPATSAYAEPEESGELDSAFNAGIGDRSESTRGLSEPRRPETTRESLAGDDESGLLEPIRDPVRDSFSLPPVNREYTVKAGDTLSGIARSEGVALDDLLSANELEKASTIYVGQSLLIPESAPEEAVAESEAEHAGHPVTVRRGDTLSTIAKRHDTTVAILRELNDLRGDTIYVGQELMVPGEAPGQSRGANGERSSRESRTSGGESYTVQAGDTPSSIARRFDLSAAELMRANNIMDARRLYVGRELVIPGGSGNGRRDQGEASEPEPEEEPEEPAMRETTSPAPEEEEESGSDEDDEADAMSALESLDDEDLPFVEVEMLEEAGEPSN